MEIKITDITTWELAKKAALFTVGKTKVVNQPTEEWIDDILCSEHSPIREKMFHIEIIGLPYWVANHFRTHFLGANYYISTSREDRTESRTPRHKLPQDAPVNMLISGNAQTLINISRERLCGQSAPETIEIWEAVEKAMAEHCPVMAKYMVRECEYRNGFCPEKHPCKRFKKRK